MKVSSWFLIVPAILAIGSTARADFLLKWGSPGTGDGQFNGPRAVAVDASGNVYVADQGNNRIQKFDGNGNFLTKWGSAGIGDGQFYEAAGVAVDASGDVFVVDTFGSVQKFDGTGTFLTKWGSVGVDNGQFASPFGVALDVAGNVYVADTFNDRIQKFDGNGAFISKWSSNSPRGVAVDGSGNVYAIEGTTSANNRVDKYDGNGNLLTSWGSAGVGDGQFNTPSSVAVDASGNVYVTDMNNHRIQKFTSGGTFIAKWGEGGSCDGHFSFPTGIAVDSNLNVYVCDTSNNRVQKFGLGIGVDTGPCPVDDVTPEDQIAALSGGVQALVTGGVLLPSQGNSLLTKLDGALGLLTHGNMQGAISKLGDFIKQVTSFIKTGKLTSAQGQPLIDAARALIAELQASALSATPVAAGGSKGRDIAGARAGSDPRLEAASGATASPFHVYPGTFDAARRAITLRFDLPRRSDVTLELYDIAGRRIDEMRLGSMGPGRQEWTSARLDLPSALVFYRLRAGDLMATGKVPFVR
jgi:sugar lactone lactonase YvrE